MKFKKIILSLISLIPIFAHTMERPLPAIEANPIVEPAPLIATPMHSAPSLRELAAHTLCRAMHPNNSSVALNQTKALALKAHGLPEDLKNYLLRRLVIENADAFEAMNQEKPVVLTKRSNCCSCQVTKDTKKVWFLEGSWQHTNKLICLDIPTGTETILDLAKTPYRIATVDDMEGDDHFCPNEDGSEIAFACFHRGHHANIFLVTYNVHTKQFNEIMQLPTRNIQLKSFHNNQLIANRTQVNNPQEARTYLIDCAQKRIKATVPQSLLRVSHSAAHFATYDRVQRTMALYAANGTLINQFPHYANRAPGFNADETIIATIVDNNAITSSMVHIWDIKTHQLLYKVKYPFSVGEVLFTNDDCIIAFSCQNNNGTYEVHQTNLKTQHTKLLVESNFRVSLNHDGTLSLAGSRCPITLASTENQKNIKTYNAADESWIHGTGFVNNDEHIMLYEARWLGSFRNTRITRYATHRALTKGKTLKELLDLCITARDKKEQTGWMAYLYNLIDRG